MTSTVQLVKINGRAVVARILEELRLIFEHFCWIYREIALVCRFND